MRRSNFGKRRGTPLSNSEIGAVGQHQFKTSDVVGLVVLSVMLFLIVDGSYLEGHSANAVIDFICRAIELPVGFASDWALRASITTPVDQSFGGPFGELIMPSWRSFLVVAHQASLVVGLGAAFFLDLYLAQFLRHRVVSQQTLDLVQFGSHLVSWGLSAIWLTGGAILFYYFMWAPELLQNPKIWAKLVIVLALTINGMLIHRVALDGLRHCLGRSILDQNFPRVAITFLPMVAISTVSWGFAFVLGAFRELNNTYDSQSILIGYFVLLATVYCILVLTCAVVRKPTTGNASRGPAYS
ncbi:MAG: hypothetical protein ABJH63_00745 [Rhizobiaceae bacterium]